MSPIGIIFTLIASVFLFLLPRRLAALPLLIGIAYMTRGQELVVGGAHFPIIRILVVVGVVRVLAKGEKIVSGINRVDIAITLWAVWLLGSSAFHTPDAWFYRSGLIWTELGCYILFRILLEDYDGIVHTFKILCVALIPLALFMLFEKMTGKNFFAALGGVGESPAYRNGHYRAQGSFAHAILAGTVGAGLFPLALGFWKNDRGYALLGLFAAVGIVFASTSSGPVMVVIFILFGLSLWKVRQYLWMIRWLVVFFVVALDIAMKSPVYYLMARIDISGGSTGWHRARLIESSIIHLNEWWLTGTDRTRHWMPTGVHANEIHTDITNHFLKMGVLGGLPLMILWITVMVAAFSLVGKALQLNEHAPFECRFLIWTIGVILFGHTVNFFSISYFDQSIVFLYLILASAGTLQSVIHGVKVETPKTPVPRFVYSRYAMANRKTNEGV